MAAYVGPVYSYYEFTHPAEQRLNDQQWQQLIVADKLPPRPDWTKPLTSAPVRRSYNGLSVQSQGHDWVVMKSINGRLKEEYRVKNDDDGLRKLLKGLDSRGFSGHFGLPLGNVSQDGLQSLVEVTQLAWIDVTNSKISEQAIKDFRRRRPDVTVLPPPFGVETVAVCRQVDGLRRFEADESGKLQPGKPLLLYVEPANLTWRRWGFSLGAKLKVTAKLSDATGTAVATHVSDPLELRNGRPGELVYTTVKMAIPKSLKRGAYKLQVELTDALTNPVRTATADLTLEY